MPQARFSALGAAADELRAIVQENAIAKANAEMERQKLSRQSMLDEREERKLRLQEQPGLEWVTQADGSRVLMPKAPGLREAPPAPELEWATNPDGSKTLRPKAAGLTSAAPPQAPELEWATNPDGSRTLRRKVEGLTSAPPPRTPRNPSFDRMTLVGPDGRQVVFGVDLESGQTRQIDLPDGFNVAGGTPAQKPPTGAQEATLGFFNRMKEAIDIMEEVENQVTDRDLIVINESPLPEFINYRLLSPAGQRYARAQKQYTEARLRKESGAAIPENEYQSDRMVIMRQQADTPETLADRRRSRRTTLSGFGNQAGPAYDAYYGRSFDPAELEAGNAGGAGGAVTVKDPMNPSKSYTFDSQAKADAFVRRRGGTVGGR
jgi:hypothetical protein